MGTLKDKAGGGARLERELIEPLLPEGSGFEPFLTDDFFGAGRGRGIRAQVSPPCVGRNDQFALETMRAR